MDEIRIQHSDYFSANPNSTPNDSIPVPTVAYSAAVVDDRRIIVITKFTPLESGGYDRHVEKHWYTHKDI